jgi:hypothetical protein
MTIEECRKEPVIFRSLKKLDWNPIVPNLYSGVCLKHARFYLDWIDSIDWVFTGWFSGHLLLDLE